MDLSVFKISLKNMAAPFQFIAKIKRNKESLKNEQKDKIENVAGSV
jgi:hypothetical protein